MIPDPSPKAAAHHGATRSLVLGLAIVLLAPSAGAPLGAEEPASDIPGREQLRSWLAQDRWREVLENPGVAGGQFPGIQGEALLRGGRIDEAEEVLEALAATPDASASALVALARIRAARGSHERAAELIERAVASPVTDPRVLFWAADIEADRSVAVSRLERYLELGDVDADRLESARGSLRMLRALGELEIWVPSARPERAELPLERLLAADGRKVGYVVKVTLGEGTRPVRLLLDTGAGGLFVVQRVARKRGFVPLAEETLFGGGGDRRHATERGFFPRLDIGGLVFDNALASLQSQEFEPHGRYHGLLGLTAFRGYRVTIDLKKRRLLLERGATLERGTPFVVFSGQMLASARLGQTTEGLFLVDTGATRTLVSRAALERFDASRVGGPAKIRAFGGALEGAQIVSGLEIGLAGRQHRGDFWAADLSVRNRLGGVELGGFLGLDFWGNSRIVIDTLSQRLEVTAPR